MPVKLSNLAKSTLSASINGSVTSLSIASGDADKFPTLAAGEWFPLVVVENAGNREIMRVTGRTGASLTVVRGQEGTAARAFASGSTCELRLTVAALAELVFASGARGATQSSGDSSKALATTEFVQQEFSAFETEVNALLDTLEESVTDTANTRVRFFAAGDALPSSDVGPIWHALYNSLMTWQVFDQNSASYAGYASVDIGDPLFLGQPTAKPGYVKRNGASYSKTTYAALWNWALHNGRVVALGSWTAGAFVFADNGDGTFKVPDNRASFERAWDDGRGVDTGRALGSSQASQNLAHNHGVTDPGHAHSTTFFATSKSGTATPTVLSYSEAINGTTPVTSNAAVTGISIQNSGGSEARPLNVAFNACIKF